MSSSRHVYQLPPCPAWDVEGTESWLTDQAAAGLMLAKDGFFAGFATFERTEPQTVRYRLEAAPKPVSFWADDGGKPDPEAENLNAAYGWEYVASRGQFYIYRTNSPEARELNTDPKVQAIALDLVRKRERGNCLNLLFWTLFYPVLGMRGGILLVAVEVGSWFFLWTFLLVLWFFLRSLAGLLYLRKLRKKLASGEAPDHRRDWRKPIARHRLATLALILVCGAWAAVALHLWSNEVMDVYKQPLTDQAQLPFATMADFLPGDWKRADMNWTNTIERRTDWLAPDMIHFNESGSVSLGDGRTLQGGLIIDYYEARTDWLAHWLFLDLQRAAKRARDYEVLPAVEVGADETAAYQEYFPTLLIRQGNKVLQAVFYQTSPNYTMPREQWGRVLADSIQ